MSWDVIKHPHVTEKAMNDMDFQNKLQFAVDDRASKGEVADAVEEQYDVTVEQVNTQNTMDGEKKAVVRLSEDDDAQEVASRIGVF
ncbi:MULTISPECIES: 50S ribosomal protein L23 [Haloarcula]|mgnify:FL=1|jgi:large subunit ribosomal protein L23|uniref:Large ribosomal subunit protein uL23 n=15 Tax=cellular organisms TaxID=131567 RepID=RL23_HALMA|nr:MULTISPECIES: 50S ribosomal protein L23 [Haloarcula]P12732.2 RecName: Full=Large ribosomal subunit protein uL23; AltName: Full=50S ribosomal protein L23; AltName: Full=Hl25; AltName: Full=Hmal23; AltName: Full=L21 [Haloarcula marismortui ATCC 43049]1S72_S Chain S, 50S ribosomal protein L23P [Haloarcula marismortui]1VQ4_S Chain S, 50S ribosomal protein L23P [Haloarcula marismortui]1VQ5_S Chain S, 50S ribosomal protein L23P [Haloarcula marismortui]1VQ6_S Chain S, 50S ribosomal protein L23P [H